jgi:hypothetical protein
MATTADKSIPVYPWFDVVPEGLKTRNQLKEQGLRPGGPVKAKVVWNRGKRHADLYDLAEAVEKKPASEAQKSALAKANEVRRTCSRCGFLHGSLHGFRNYGCVYCSNMTEAVRRNNAIEHAKNALADSSMRVVAMTGGELLITDVLGTKLFRCTVQQQRDRFGFVAFEIASEDLQTILGMLKDRHVYGWSYASRPSFLGVELGLTWHYVLGMVEILGQLRIVDWSYIYEFKLAEDECKALLEELAWIAKQPLAELPQEQEGQAERRAAMQEKQKTGSQ